MNFNRRLQLLIGLFLIASPVWAETQTIFEQEDYTSPYGFPTSFNDSFSTNSVGAGYELILDVAPHLSIPPDPYGAAAFSSLAAKPTIPTTYATVTLNGVVIISDSEFNSSTVQIKKEVALLNENEITVTVRGLPYGESYAVDISIIGNLDPINLPPVFQTDPLLSIEHGAPYIYPALAVDPEGGSVTYELNGDSSFSINSSTGVITNADPIKGVYPLAITATDEQNASDTQEFVVSVVDTTAPNIVVPLDINFEATAILSEIDIGVATASDNVDGALTPISSNLGPYPLGQTEVLWSATDSSGNSNSAIQTINVQDTTPPELILPDNLIVIGTPPISVNLGEAQATDIFEPVTITNDAPDYFGIGETSVTWQATDVNGNTSLGIQTIIVDQEVFEDLPPDPAEVAPSLPDQPTIPFDEKVSFIYSGQNPIQTVQDVTVFDENRVSIVRGKVIDQFGNAIPNVDVIVHGESQFGSTKTRLNGFFDLAVNGGKDYVIEFNHMSYMKAQRQLSIDWNEYRNLDNSVVLMPYDSQFSTLNFLDSATWQTHRSSLVEDFRGDRRVTALIPPQTSATATMPDGSTIQLTQGTLRISEYTQGGTAISAMPGTLPNSTQYTYAANFTLDEAEAMDAVKVEFDRPITWYVDNFIGFTNGTTIPVGYYDFESSTWMPDFDGRAMTILGIDETESKAIISFNENLEPASESELEEMFITDEELVQLAILYPNAITSQISLWRVQSQHFTPIDCNPGPIYAFGNPEVPKIPNQSPPEQNESFPVTAAPIENNESNPGTPLPHEMCSVPGCVINPETRVLRESIAIPGTPLEWSYKSFSGDGKAVHDVVHIPMSRANYPEGLLAVTIEIEVSGQKHNYTYYEESFPLDDFTFEWNGKDVYGRPVESSKANIDVYYHYPIVYVEFPWVSEEVSKRAKSFASNEVYPAEYFNYRRYVTYGDTPLNVVENYYDVQVFMDSYGDSWEVDLEATHETTDQIEDPWSPNIVHEYRAQYDTLVTGAGDKYINATAGHGYQKFRLAGDGTNNRDAEEGVPATSRGIRPSDALYAPDGEMYFSDVYMDYDGYFSTTVWTIDELGNFKRFGGGGSPYDNSYIFENGADATTVNIRNVRDMDFDNFGNLIILEEAPYLEQIRLLKISDNGQIYVEGTFSLNSSWENEYPRYCPYSSQLPANIADIELGDPTKLKVLKDNSYLIVDDAYGAVFKFIPGLNELYPFLGCINSEVNQKISDIAVLDSGEVLVVYSQGFKVEKILPSGQVTLFAGTALNEISGLNGKAIEAGIGNVTRVIPYIDNSVLLAGYHSDIGVFLLKVDAQGNITHFMGGEDAIHKDPITFELSNLLVSRSGEILIVEFNEISELRNSRINSSIDETIILSQPNGEFLFYFDDIGRHIKTVDAVTGLNLYVFQYTDDQLLEFVVDQFGNNTALSYTGNLPTEIVSSFGLTTFLDYNENGWLDKIRLPDSSIYSFEYQGYNLSKITDPNGNSSEYTYDEFGLINEFLPTGGIKNFTGKVYESNSGFSSWSRYLTPEGLEYFYRNNGSVDGSKNFTRLTPNGISNRINQKLNGDSISEIFDSYGNEIVTEVYGTQDQRFPTITKPKLIESKLSNGLYSVARTTESTTTYEYSQSSDDFFPSKIIRESSVNGVRNSISIRDLLSNSNSYTSPLGVKSEVVFNEFDRPVEISIPGSFTTYLDYYPTGKLKSISQGNRTTSYSYNEFGYLNEIHDPDTKVTTFYRDRMGRIEDQINTDSTPLNFDYDSKGHLTSINLPTGHEHKFTYGLTDQIETYIPPVPDDNYTIGAKSQEFPATSYLYNLDGELTTVTRPDGKIVSFLYNQISGQLYKVVTDSSEYTIEYEDLSGISNIEVTDGINIAMDYLGKNVTKIEWDGTAFGFTENPKIEFQYDDFFEAVNFQLYDGTSSQTNYSTNLNFNADGQPIQVGDLALHYDSNGLLNYTTILNSRHDTSYNSYGELDSHTISDNDGLKYSVSIETNSMGQVQTKTETIGTEVYTYEYEYTQIGQLKSVTKNGTEVENYLYDLNGNRTHEDGVLVATYDAQDRLLNYENTQFTYTAAGELSTQTNGNEITTYTHDALSNLKTVVLPDGTVIDYILDGNNRRVGKKRNGVLEHVLIYKDQTNPIAILNESGQIVSRFIYGVSGHVPEIMYKNNTVYRIVTDQIGSVKLVINLNDNSVVQAIEYDSFGRIISDSNPGFQPFAFAGGVYDQDTKLINFGSRNYSPSIGRWITKDLAHFTAADTNLYAYVSNNPISYVDSSGYGINFVLGGVGALIGGVYGGIDAALSGKNIGWGITKGTATGGLAGITFGGSLVRQAAKGLVLGAVADVAIDLGEQYAATKQTQCINWKQTGQVFGSSLLFGSFGKSMGMAFGLAYVRKDLAETIIGGNAEESVHLLNNSLNGGFEL